MQTETMLWLCNFKQKKKKISIVLKQRNTNKKTNSPDSSLSVDPYRLQSNVSHRHRLQSHDSHRHRRQSHDFQFILSGSSTKKKFSRPETLAGTITEFLEHIDVDDHQDVLDLLDRQEQSTADDELLQRRFEQTTAVVRWECPDRDPDYLVKPSGKLSDPQAHLLNYPTFSTSKRRNVATERPEISAMSASVSPHKRWEALTTPCGSTELNTDFHTSRKSVLPQSSV
ncbi:hypothetical protein D6C93_08612 [Aureobasidium pullulans]|nr:hypothetical protein D6C93_08612 [Aureobasidium pullulans]